MSTLCRFPEVKFSLWVWLKADLISGYKDRFEEAHQTVTFLLCPVPIPAWQNHTGSIRKAIIIIKSNGNNIKRKWQ
ncbi:hypothetical protein [Flavobacterium sp. NRK1]|uniref:hypothetical protein n=1 Tax=Flavobacterium sp. NRK1 TaxID=2954929 RepID=UPI00209400E9|nr:hypothetical protein [Flavobacterium sp. NRK1]MCO6148665.1 hypothetical protein [Flavobacterium sp. NRK1]